MFITFTYKSSNYNKQYIFFLVIEEKHFVQNSAHILVSRGEPQINVRIQYIAVDKAIKLSRPKKSIYS